MTEIDAAGNGRPVVLAVVSAATQTRQRLVDALAAAVGDAATVIAATSAHDAVLATRDAAGTNGVVPLAFVAPGERTDDGVDALVALRGEERFGDTRFVLVTRSTSLQGFDRALRSGALHGMVTEPWTTTGLVEMLAAQLATHLVEHAPELLVRFDQLLDQDDRVRAEQRIAQRRDAPEGVEERIHPLLDDTRDDESVERELIAALDRALGHPPRIRIGPGTTMIESGDDVGGIYVILSGVVRLTSTTEDGEVILHERSTGAIVGLLSLASRRRALLTCRSVTEVRAIPVTLDQLARAMNVEPTVSGLLNRVLIASLATRLRRSDILQAELDRSLAALSEARAQLVANARFTTLGELSAGMAHELNNPAAALQRAIDHVAEDVGRLLPPAEAAAIEERRAAHDPDLSTAERRALRRDLAERYDARLADRYVSLGARSVDDAAQLDRLTADELARREATRHLGTALRNAGRAATRVQALVDSLRAYARGDDGRGALVNDVDVERTIDSALHLVAHRVGEATIVREHEPDLPVIVGRPGALQHVWTNLLSNALDATGGSGTIVLRTSADEGHVTVLVEDDGPGIPPELVDRVFEPRFTTKQGRVSYGLGLGLSIVRQTVADHDGTVEVESRPGSTVFTVRLPIAGPAQPDATITSSVPLAPADVPADPPTVQEVADA